MAKNYKPLCPTQRSTKVAEQKAVHEARIGRDAALRRVDDEGVERRKDEDNKFRQKRTPQERTREGSVTISNDVETHSPDQQIFSLALR